MTCPLGAGQAVAVVVLMSGVDDAADIAQADEPVLRETYLPKCIVELSLYGSCTSLPGAAQSSSWQPIRPTCELRALYVRMTLGRPLSALI